MWKDKARPLKHFVGQWNSAWKWPVGTQEVYSFDVPSHGYVTHAVPLLLWGTGLRRTCPCSPTVGNPDTHLQNCHPNPGRASTRPGGRRRRWDVFQQPDSDRTRSSGRAFTWTFSFFFVQLFTSDWSIRALTRPSCPGSTAPRHGPLMHDLWPFVLVWVVECRRLWAPDSRILSVWPMQPPPALLISLHAATILFSFSVPPHLHRRNATCC